MILIVSWIARAVGMTAYFAGIKGDIFYGIVGVVGAIVMGEIMRAFVPRTTYVLLGGR